MCDGFCNFLVHPHLKLIFLFTKLLRSIKCTFFLLSEKIKKEITAKGSTGIEVILSTLEVCIGDQCDKFLEHNHRNNASQLLRNRTLVFESPVYSVAFSVSKSFLAQLFSEKQLCVPPYVLSPGDRQSTMAS